MLEQKIKVFLQLKQPLLYKYCFLQLSAHRKLDFIEKFKIILRKRVKNISRILKSNELIKQDEISKFSIKSVAFDAWTKLYLIYLSLNFEEVLFVVA